MKYLSFVLLVLFSIGCTGGASPEAADVAAPVAADTSATNADTDQASSDSPALAGRSAPAEFLTAVGNEPGWILKMQKAGDGSFPAVLVYSYGADTLTGTFPANAAPPAGTTIAANQQFFAAQLDLRGKAVPVEVLVTKEKCTDDAGMERPVQVKLTVDKSWHPGCGSYAGN